MKNGKAAGLDDICIEQIKHSGRLTKLRVKKLFNYLFASLRIPKIWRKARVSVIAILKPGKESKDQRKTTDRFLYFVMCINFSRIILNRLAS